MVVVLAPDSFKESMTAAQAAAAMAEGVRRAWPDADCVLLPLADGGEGTLAALAGPMHARLRPVATTDAYGRPILADYGLAGTTAVIETATVIGLGLVPPNLRDPEHATTRGLAAVFLDALDAGATRLIVGIGGTAICDGGAGLLAGLGARLLDRDGVPISEDPVGLRSLHRVVLDELDPRLAEVEITVASDVTNPLLGPQGAAAVFAPQKGARVDQLPRLEDALTRWADALVGAGLPERRDAPGAGAAGGLGLALAAVGGRRRSGFAVVAEAIGLAEAIRGAELVITGEGSLDAQTAAGKAPFGVLELGRALGVPVLAVAGRVDDPAAMVALGFAGAIAVTPATLAREEAFARAAELTSAAVAAELTRWTMGRP